MDAVVPNFLEPFQIRSEFFEGRALFLLRAPGEDLDRCSVEELMGAAEPDSYSLKVWDKTYKFKGEIFHLDRAERLALIETKKGLEFLEVAYEDVSVVVPDILDEERINKVGPNGLNTEEMGNLPEEVRREGGGERGGG